MAQYNYIIFDFDGTLFYTLDSLLPVYETTFSKIGVKLTKEDCQKYIKFSLWECLKWHNKEGKEAKELFDFFHKEMLKDDIVSKVVLYEDAKRLIHKLNDADIPYGIISGNSEKNIRTILSYHQLKSFKFQDILGNESSIKYKPDKEPLLSYIKRNNLNKHEYNILYIGDAEVDKEFAKNAGIDYLIVNRVNKIGENEISSLDEAFDYIVGK